MLRAHRVARRGQRRTRWSAGWNMEVDDHRPRRRRYQRPASAARARSRLVDDGDRIARVLVGRRRHRGRPARIGRPRGRRRRKCRSAAGTGVYRVARRCTRDAPARGAGRTRSSVAEQSRAISTLPISMDGARNSSVSAAEPRRAASVRRRRAQAVVAAVKETASTWATRGSGCSTLWRALQRAARGRDVSACRSRSLRCDEVGAAGRRDGRRRAAQAYERTLDPPSRRCRRSKLVGSRLEGAEQRERRAAHHAAPRGAGVGSSPSR